MEENKQPNLSKQAILCEGKIKDIYEFLESMDAFELDEEGLFDFLFEDYEL